MSKGKLYICGTPIGNLDDITFRVLETLREVDMIAAEDTRRTSKLLNYFEIDNSLTSYHEHNEKVKAQKLLSRLEEGDTIALVSDAGMPGISDPGQEIIKRAIEKGIEVIPVPGPTAVSSALVVSGLPMNSFVFEGFVPRKGDKRQEFINRLQKETRTTILYESPYRLRSTLKNLKTILTTRKIAVVREISKVHEEKLYGRVSEVLSKLEGKDIKGEIVIVIEGREDVKIEDMGWEELSILEHLELMIENGYTKKEAIKKVARIRELPKKQVYKEAIVIDASVSKE